MSEVISILMGIVALATSAWAAREAKRVADIERDRDRVALAQAVNAWSVVVRSNGQQDRYGVLISNVGTAPVFQLSLEHTSANNISWSRRLPVVPPGSYFVEKTGFPVGVEEVVGQVRPLMATEKIRVSQLAFTDANGIAWVRSDGVTLKEAPPSA